MSSNGKWSPEKLPSLDGRTAIVTGSNSGIGLAAARELAGAGVRVVKAVRNTEKGEAAASALEGTVEVRKLDLADLSSVREFASGFDGDVDLLINNAGVMIPPRTTTADGFELQLGTNHFGHFAYTGQVLDTLLRTPGSRVVTVSSLAHQQGRMRWDDLDWVRSYDRMAAYSQSKLANLLFTFELDRRLTAAGAEPVALAAHPGLSSTDLARYLPGATLPGLKQLAGAVVAMVFNSAADGALATLRAATDPEARGSEFYGPSGPREIRGRPVLVMPRAHAADAGDMARLWTISEERTGVRYPI
jgi:NAD(P)-dependent dehydrogenase (short-subunit alcohol dehydrogenase family)